MWSEYSNVFNVRIILFWYKTCVNTYSCIWVNLTTTAACTRITFNKIRGGADKSLAQPTSPCRRTESIASLERGVCSCAELQVFSCYRGWKEARQATRMISTTSRRKLSSSFFFPARQGAEGNSHHSDRNIRGTCTMVWHHQKLCGPD